MQVWAGLHITKQSQIISMVIHNHRTWFQCSTIWIKEVKLFPTKQIQVGNKLKDKVFIQTMKSKINAYKGQLSWMSIYSCIQHLLTPTLLTQWVYNRESLPPTYSRCFRWQTIHGRTRNILAKSRQSLEAWPRFTQVRMIIGDSFLLSVEGKKIWEALKNILTEAAGMTEWTWWDGFHKNLSSAQGKHQVDIDYFIPLLEDESKGNFTLWLTEAKDVFKQGDVAINEIMKNILKVGVDYVQPDLPPHIITALKTLVKVSIFVDVSCQQMISDLSTGHHHWKWKTYHSHHASCTGSFQALCYCGI